MMKAVISLTSSSEKIYNHIRDVRHDQALVEVLASLFSQLSANVRLVLQLGVNIQRSGKVCNLI
jgi:hypothetical protein